MSEICMLFTAYTPNRNMHISEKYLGRTCVSAIKNISYSVFGAIPSSCLRLCYQLSPWYLYSAVRDYCIYLTSCCTYLSAVVQNG